MQHDIYNYVLFNPSPVHNVSEVECCDYAHQHILIELTDCIIILCNAQHYCTDCGYRLSWGLLLDLASKGACRMPGTCSTFKNVYCMLTHCYIYMIYMWEATTQNYTISRLIGLAARKIITLHIDSITLINTN